MNTTKINVPEPPKDWGQDDKSWLIAYSTYREVPWFKEKYLKPKTELIPFKFEETPVRIVIDKQGEPHWIVKDVCDSLGLPNVTMALKKIEEKHINRIEVLDSRGVQHSMPTIDESGLYQLVLRSNKQKAKKFREWVTGVVLPTIRKTGSYSVQSKTDALTRLDVIAEVIAVSREHELQLRDHSNTLDNHETRMTDMSQEITDVRREVSEVKQKQLADPVKQLSFRARIRIGMALYGKYHGNSREDFRRYYNHLYAQFYYRYGINLVLRAKNAGVHAMDIAEKMGVIEDLYKLAKSIFVVKVN